MKRTRKNNIANNFTSSFSLPWRPGGGYIKVMKYKKKYYEIIKLFFFSLPERDSATWFLTHLGSTCLYDEIVLIMVLITRKWPRIRWHHTETPWSQRSPLRFCYLSMVFLICRGNILIFWILFSLFKPLRIEQFFELSSCCWRYFAAIFEYTYI